MTAENYLEKISYYDACIESCRDRVKKHKEAAEKRTSNLSANKVQSSPNKEKMADAVVSYSDIEATIKEYEEKRQEIIDTIGTLPPKEAIVLHKRYVDDKTLYAIAKEAGRAYEWASRHHRSGKRNIQRILDEREKAGV